MTEEHCNDRGWFTPRLAGTSLAGWVPPRQGPPLTREELARVMERLRDHEWEDRTTSREEVKAHDTDRC